MYDRPSRACARPSTLLGEQSTEVSHKREREEEARRTKRAVKRAFRQVHRAIRGQQISAETAATARRLIEGEADRAAIFFNKGDG
jgi:hypothetical protein